MCAVPIPWREARELVNANGYNERWGDDGGEQVAPSGRARRRLPVVAGPSILVRSLWIGVRILGPLILLLCVGIGIGYVRLLNGPISLKSYTGKIATAIQSELPQFRVKVDDAFVLLTSDRGLELRLSYLKFSDLAGTPIALAPRAALALSPWALIFGRIAPERIVLIKPKLRLQQVDGRISLSFSESPAAASTNSRPGDGGAKRQPNVGLRGTVESAEQTRARLDVTRLMASAQSGLGKSWPRSYLRGMGVRDATLILTHQGRKLFWQVRSARFDLSGRGAGRLLTGNASVRSREANWTMQFAAGADDKVAEGVVLRLQLNKFVPRSIAPLMPGVGLAGMLAAPLSGDIKLAISKAGELGSIGGRLKIGRGKFRFPGALTQAVDRGTVEFSYNAVRDHLKIKNANFRWGKNSVDWIAEGRRVSTAPGAAWQFAVATKSGSLFAPEFGVAKTRLDKFEVRGLIAHQGRQVRIDTLKIAAGGGAIDASGQLVRTGKLYTHRFSGVISSLKTPVIKALWPRALVPVFRKWAGEQVLGGTIDKGRFSASGAFRLAGRDAPPVAERRKVVAAFEASNLKIEPAPRSSPVVAPRALIRVNDDTLEVVLPKAKMVLPSGKTLTLKTGRLLSSNVWARQARGAFTIAITAPLAAGIELMRQDAFGGEDIIGKERITATGRIQGNLNVSVPLGEDLGPEDLTFKLDGQVIDAAGKRLVGKYDVEGGSLNFTVTERTADLGGKFLLRGVPVNVGWQHIFRAGASNQPPIRLQAVLNDADRRRLGLTLGGLIQGPTPVEVRLVPQKVGPRRLLVTADLTNATLAIKSLAWRKAARIAAKAEFEIVEDNKVSRLKDFKVVGRNIALEGRVLLDKTGRARAFDFPVFALNVVSQLSVSGRLSKQKVWKVKVKGRNFDGRQLFRSFYSIGGGDSAQSKNDRDLDLVANIDNVIGHGDVSMRKVNVRLSRRKGAMRTLTARGVVDAASKRRRAQSLEVELKGTQAKRNRRLVAQSADAGQVLKMVGFYPKMQGGKLNLYLRLDRRGAVEKTGQLIVRDFNIYGDRVVGEVLQAPGKGRRKARRRVVREVLEFNWMRVPFSVGQGQFVLHNAELRGPLLGVSMKGKADFQDRVVSLGGTYVPLQGLNAMFKDLPLLGEILSGPRGEGMLGVVFAIRGPMDNPTVLVNPLSVVAPGIFREMFQMTDPRPEVTPRSRGGGSGVNARQGVTRSGQRQKRLRRQKHQSDDGRGWISETDED